MIINGDGTVYLEKGEPAPFLCPKCGMPIAFDDKADIIECPRCHHKDSWIEFSDGTFSLVPIQ